jgi:Pyruvate/2-oxoacid:ferredoxin oxidoreductase gamma subunit
MTIDSLTIRVAGEGGEGVLRCGEVLAGLLAHARHHVLVHRAAPRTVGAPAAAELRVGAEPVRALTGNLDALFVWSQDAYDRHRDALWPEGVLLYDPDRVRPREADAPIRHGIPLTRLLADPAWTGTERPKAFVAAGVLSRLLGVPMDAGASLGTSFGEGAVRAFDEGYARSKRASLGVLRFEVAKAAAPTGGLVSGARLAAEALAHEGFRFAVLIGGRGQPGFTTCLEDAGIRIEEAEDRDRAILSAREVAAEGQPALLVSRDGLHGVAELQSRVSGASILLVCTPDDESVSEPGDWGALMGSPAPAVVAPGSIEECGAAARFASVETRAGRATALYVDPMLAECAETLTPVLRDAVEARAEERFAHAFVEGALTGAATPHAARIIAWGAMEGAVQEAVRVCRSTGLDVASLHVRRLCADGDEGWRRFLSSGSRVVVVEPEPAGPLATWLAQRYAVEPERIFWPADEPLRPEIVVDALLGG